MVVIYDPFLTMNNWHVFSGPNGVPVARPGVPNGFDCVSGGYLQWGSTVSTTGGLQGHADMQAKNKNGWRIKSVKPLALPGIFAARIAMSGGTSGGTDYEKIINAFYLYWDESQDSKGLAYMESDFEFCWSDQMHPLLYWRGVRGMHSGVTLLNTVYYGGASATPDVYPYKQIATTTTGNSGLSGFVTCIIKVELVAASPDSGENVWRTTFSMVAQDGTCITLGKQVSRHSAMIKTIDCYLDQHWQDPHSLCADPVQAGQAHPQNMSVNWFYYSSDPADRTPYDLHLLEVLA